MTCSIITFLYKFQASSPSPLLQLRRSHPLSILCKHSSINAYRYFFCIISIVFWNCIPFYILSVSCRSCFKHSLHSFVFKLTYFCSVSFCIYYCIVFCFCILSQWLYVFVGDAPIGFVNLLHLPYPLRLN